MTKIIKTYLKFQRSDRDKSTFVSYVINQDGSWRGCRESDKHNKKIVLADAKLGQSLIENVLYSATLIPMKERMGFVAISATPVKFPARIETFISDDSYSVEVRFGHKVLTYDPASPIENRRSIEGIAQTLLKRMDVKDPEQVARDFRESASIVLAYYKADHNE